MKVLQINLRSDFGGGPHHMHQLILNLSKKVTVFVAQPKEYPYWERNLKLVEEKNCLELPHRKFTLAALLALVKFIKTNQIELLHAQGKGASIYARLASILTRVPCVYTFHGLHYGKYSYLHKKLYFFLENLLALFTKAFISVSESERKEAITIFPLTKSKVHYIPNGVNIPVTYDAPCTHSDKIIICTIARLDYQKNLEMLIPIAQRLYSEFHKKVVINVIGVPDEDNSLKQKIISNGLQEIIYLKGFTLDTSLWLKEACIYLSTSRWEGLPISILEASSYGLPVIATDVQGNKNAVVHEETGFLYPLLQPEIAVSFIKALLLDPILYKKISTQSYSFVKEKFAIEKMAKETEALYYKVVNK